MKPARCLISLVLVLLMAAPAAANHGGIHPTFQTQHVYFHCTGDTPVQQVNWLTTGGSSSSYGAWDTSPPPGSVADGEGCAASDMGGVSFAFFDAVFAGRFVGNIRDLTIRIYDFVLNNDREEKAAVRVRIYAEVDDVSVVPTRANSGLTDKFEFSVTNIGFADEIRDDAGNVIDVETGGAAREDGNGSAEHEIRIWLGLEDSLGEEPQASGHDIFVWDTTEVPSGITFNPSSLATATVQADTPKLD